MITVTIDEGRCHGHARCWTICPEVFDIDDLSQQAVVVLASVGGDLGEQVRKAAAECPERAILLTES